MKPFHLLIGVALLAGCSSTPPVITQAECDQVQTGQSLSAVQAIIGDAGKEASRVETPGAPITFSQQWINKDGGNAIAIFQDDKLTSKTCYGLK